jgi:hypothetical protein
MEHVLTPNVRVAVFREMKRAMLDHMRESPDKYPNRLTWQEYVAFVAGCRYVGALISFRPSQRLLLLHVFATRVALYARSLRSCFKL